MIEKIVDEIFKKIIAHNLTTSSGSIPHSDTFYKEVESNVGIDLNTYKQIIQILNDSHKILTIAISKEDKDRNIEKVEGYVDADISTVRKLRDYYQRLLVDMYEEENNNRLPIHQVIRELFPKLDLLSKTPIGAIANKAIMLDEFEKLLEKEFQYYNEDFKAKKLNELLLELEKTSSPLKSGKGTEKTGKKSTNDNTARRAVDSNKYKKAKDFSKSSLNKILQIYGVEFFFRINLRKYNFNFIREIIESRQIDNKADLRSLKDMIQKMKKNTGADPKLLDFSDDIKKLERAVSKYINYKKYW